MCGKCLFNAGPGQPSSEDTWLITSKRASTVDWLEEECPKKGTILKRITHLQPCPHSQISPNLSPNLEKMTQSPRNGVSWLAMPGRERTGGSSSLCAQQITLARTGHITSLGLISLGAK